jgi:hypothetical protein
MKPLSRTTPDLEPMVEYAIMGGSVEPMVEYAIMGGSVVFAIPRRSIQNVPDCFFAVQLNVNMSEVTSEAYGDARHPISVELTSPMFQDSAIFSLVMDYLNCRLDHGKAATLRRAGLELSEEQWRNLNEAERFVFGSCDCNPYWIGLSGQDFAAHGQVSKDSGECVPVFDITPSASEIVVRGPGRFFLGVDVFATMHPVERPVSLIQDPSRGGEYPFHVDFKTSFFIPATAITCVIDGERTVCEGVLECNGNLRIEPVDVGRFTWFYFAVHRRRWLDCKTVYGHDLDG